MKTQKNVTAKFVENDVFITPFETNPKLSMSQDEKLQMPHREKKVFWEKMIIYFIYNSESKNILTYVTFEFDPFL